MEKGDYIYDHNSGVSFILKDYKKLNDGNCFCTAFSAYFEKSIVFNAENLLIIPPFNVNNPEIIDELDKALFKEGYYFDTDNLEMSEKRWDSGIDEDYYVPTFEYLCSEDYELGIMCKTKEEALILEKVALDAIRKYLTNKK